MAWENIITSIDIGTSKIRTLIGSFAEEEMKYHPMTLIEY